MNVMKISRQKNNFISKKKKKISLTRLPTTKAEMSSNWKAFLETLPPQTKKHQKVQSNYIDEKKESEIWFDDVDPELLEETKIKPKSTQVTQAKSIKGLVKDGSFSGRTHVIGIDCEMVGVGWDGKESILARVSIVNHYGHCLLDKYVKPREKVTDYRTSISGIRPSDLEKGEDFKTVQQAVSDLLRGRLLIGHSLKYDLNVLFLDHPRRNMRDTSNYPPFKIPFGGSKPSLKNLTSHFLGIQVQTGEHSSVQDAQAAMRLYTMHRKDWEEWLKSKRRNATTPKLKQRKNIVQSVKASSAAVSDTAVSAIYVDSDEE